MPSYVITGANRGLGLEFVKQLAKIEHNVIIAIVRDKLNVKDLESLVHGGRVHIVEGDITDPESMKSAASATSEIVNGSLDYLINNAALVATPAIAGKSLSTFGAEEIIPIFQNDFLVNTLGPIIATNAFLPLLSPDASLKRVIMISSGRGDVEYSKASKDFRSVPYSVSKCALEMVIVKYAQEFPTQGYTFFGVSPGWVSTSEHAERDAKLLITFRKAYPDLQGPITAEQSIGMMLGLFENLTPEKHNGEFLSQNGNKVWL